MVKCFSFPLEIGGWGVAPDRLQSIGLQRVRQESAHTYKNSIKVLEKVKLPENRG